MGLSNLQHSTASFLQTCIGAFFSCCTYNSICKQSYLHSLQPPQAITRSHTDLPYAANQRWMKKHAISQTRTKTVHSSLPTTGPPGCPPFVIFCFVFYDFLPLVLFCFVVFVSWFFLGPFLVPCFFGLLILSKHTFMYYKAVHPHT